MSPDTGPRRSAAPKVNSGIAASAQRPATAPESRHYRTEICSREADVRLQEEGAVIAGGAFIVGDGPVTLDHLDEATRALHATTGRSRMSLSRPSDR